MTDTSDSRENQHHSDRAPITAAVESEARRLVRVRSDSPITETIRSETALALEQLDRLRGFHENQLLDLLRTECYTNSELMQMEQRTPRYSPNRYPEREKLQRRLMRIGEERRRIDTSNEERMRRLEDRLLGLVTKHRQLQP